MCSREEVRKDFGGRWRKILIWTNTFCNLDKYIFQFGQIHFSIWTNTIWTNTIWTNTICNSESHGVQQRRGEERLWRKMRWNSYLDKYIYQFGQIQFAIWTNTFSILTNTICNSEIRFAIWTTTFFNLDKYKL